MRSELTELNKRVLAPYMPIQYNGVVFFLTGMTTCSAPIGLLHPEWPVLARVMAGVTMAVMPVLAVMHMNKTAPECGANPLQWLYLFWKRNVRGYWLIAEFNGKGGLTYHVGDRLESFPSHFTMIAVSLRYKKTAHFYTKDALARDRFSSNWSLSCAGIRVVEGFILLKLEDKGGDRLTLRDDEVRALFVKDPKHGWTLPYKDVSELFRSRSEPEKEQEQQAS